MITIISPTTTMDFDNISITSDLEPYFKNEVSELINILKNMSEGDISSIMKLSSDLTKLNYERYSKLNTINNPNKPALFTFSGEVFATINVTDFNEEDLSFTQNHFRILSGLYGVLTPMDNIEAYRLEMKTKLKNSKGNDLYKFWKENITNYIINELVNHKEKVVVNLASDEYVKCINLKSLPSDFRFVNITFKEYREKTNEYKVIGLYSKKARGYMSRFIIKNKIDSVEALKSFNIEGYSFNADMSDESNFVFTRD